MSVAAPGGGQTRRRVLGPVATFAAVAILGAALLALAAGSDQRATVRSLGIASDLPVLTLRPGSQACQGPITATSAVGALELFLRGTPRTTVAVTAVDAGGAAVTSGRHAVTDQTPAISLTRPIPARRPVSVCLRNVGSQRATFLGAFPIPGSGALLRHGHSIGLAVAMVMLAPHPRSLLSSLGVVFGRASLFRPGWVGAWTFWLLLAGLIGAFALAGVALAASLDGDGSEL